MLCRQAEITCAAFYLHGEASSFFHREGRNPGPSGEIQKAPNGKKRTRESRIGLERQITFDPKFHENAPFRSTYEKSPCVRDCL